jgi:hypothetical protein
LILGHFLVNLASAHLCTDSWMFTAKTLLSSNPLIQLLCRRDISPIYACSLRDHGQFPALPVDAPAATATQHHAQISPVEHPVPPRQTRRGDIADATGWWRPTPLQPMNGRTLPCWHRRASAFPQGCCAPEPGATDDLVCSQTGGELSHAYAPKLESLRETC